MKAEVLHIRVTKELLTRIDRAATFEGISRSNLATAAINDYLKRAEEGMWVEWKKKNNA